MTRGRAVRATWLVALAAALLLPAGDVTAEAAVCVRVKLEIPQKVTFERDAFEATLRLTNRLDDASIENVDVQVVVRNLSPDAPSEPIFISAPDTTGYAAGQPDGSGSIAPTGIGVAQWLLIPTAGAGGEFASGYQYGVKAIITYTAGGVPFEAETFEEVITVYPQPELALRYFLPRHVRGDDPFTAAVVEPSVPFELGVRVENVGFGTARNLRIDSAQPRIVENQFGLNAAFEIIGTWRNAELIQNTLSIPFGDVEPASCGVGAWAMTTTYEGDFVEFDASFSHAEELGGEFTSLLQSVQTDWLIHRVVDDRAGKDAAFDSLVDLYASNDGLPEVIVESDCSEEPVNPQAGTSGGTPSSVDPNGTLSGPVAVGWNYIYAADPAAGALPLRRVIRDRDGKVLHPQNGWTDIDDGDNPIVAVLDWSPASGNETYTLVYDLTEFDLTPPVTTVTPRVPFFWEDASTLIVSATTVMTLTATDNAAGVAYTEMVLDGGVLEAARPFWFGSGTHTVEFRSVDLKDNAEAFQTVTVIVDDTAPTLTVSSPADGAQLQENLPFTVSLDATDDNAAAPSVVAEIRDASDGTLVLVVSDGEEIAPNTLSPGDYVLHVTVEDDVENGAEAVVPFEVIERPAGPPRLVVEATVGGVTTPVVDGTFFGEPAAITAFIDADDLLVTQTLTLDGAPFASGTVVAAEGAHTIFMDAEDAAGRTATEEVTFVLDRTPPTFTVTGVVPGTLYESGVVPSVAVNDLYLDTSQVLLDGQPFVSGTPVTSDGVHVLSMTATDLAGNVGTREVTFTIDLLPPQITVTGVAEGQLYRTPTVATITITDATDFTSEARLNGKLYTSGAPIGDGDNVLTVTATDATGKTADVVIAFSVDATPPRIRILGVVDGGVYAAGVAADVQVEDARLDVVVIELDGATYVPGSPINVEGPHTLTVSAADLAGNESAAEVSFTVDAQAPNITVDGVEDGAVYAEPVLPEVSTDDDATLVVLLDDEPWDGEAIGDDGKHVLAVTATDPDGNQASVTVRFTIDTEPPRYVIVGVVDGGIYPGTVTPDVVLESEDIANVTATIDGATFGLGQPVSEAGEHELVVTLTDEAGNEVQDSVTFTIDPTAPLITVNGVADGAYVNADVALDATATPDGTTVSLEVDGAPYTFGDPITAEGRHVVRATATAPSGAIAVAGLVFTIDRTAPAITVAGVGDGGFYPGDVYPTWSADDDHLEGVFADVDGTFIAEGDPVTGEGAHVLTVTARDLAGNETTVVIALTIDQTPPVIVVSGVSDGASVPSPAVPEVTVDDANPGTLVVTIDGAPFLSGTPLPEAGDYVLDAKAVDLAGNVTESSVAFTVDPAREVVVELIRGGEPVADAVVFLHQADGSYTGESATSDGAGVAVFADVGPGDYRVRAHVGWSRFVTPVTTSPGPALVYEVPGEPEYDAVLYVDGTADGGEGTAAAPFARVDEAVAAAGWNTLIKVAGGTYAQGDLSLAEGVTVRGGYIAGSWRFAPFEAVTELRGGTVDLDGLDHAVLADVTVRLSGGVGVRVMGGGGLVRDVQSVDHAGAGFEVDGAEARLLNVLALRNGADGATVASGAAVEHLTSAHNGGAGLVVQDGVIGRSLVALNAGDGLRLEAGDAEEVLAGGNEGGDFAGAAGGGLVDTAGNAVGTPRFLLGALHAAYLAQNAAGQETESAGVDRSARLASAVDLRGRTTATNGTPDIGALDLGFHSWPAGELPPLEGPTVPDGCGCSTERSGRPGWTMALLALAGAALFRRRRRGA